MTRIVAGILLVLLGAGGFRPMFLELLVSRRMLHRPGPASGLDRRPLRERQDPSPPALIEFLQRLRETTRPGDTIALDFAPPNAGWGYAYWRANYLLAGRTVLPPGRRDADVVARYPPRTPTRNR